MQKIGELKEDNKDNDMLEVNDYMKIKKLKGNTLNGVKSFKNMKIQDLKQFLAR